MFDFLFQKKNGDLISILDIINSEIDSLQASKFAMFQCEDLIAGAIAKSEILIQKENGDPTLDEDYYRLNVKPNDNETGTEFWSYFVRRLLRKGEAMIIPLGGKYYVADNYEIGDEVTRAARISNVTIRAGNKKYGPLNRRFSMENVIYVRYPKKDILDVVKVLTAKYDHLVDAVCAMLKLSGNPKLVLQMDAQVNLVNKDTKKTMTRDEYAKNILKQITEDKVSILQIGKGIDLHQLKVETDLKTADLSATIKNINETTARAYGIPMAVFNGEITEKSDATNEFITYAVSEIVEAISDSLNGTVVGMNDYIAGQRITLWLGNFAHRDLFDCASAISALRGVGFNLDEIRAGVGMVPLNTDFSRARALTKNFTTDEDETTGGKGGKNE